MVSIDPARTALVAIDMHRGHLDPAVATLPLAAERCDLVIARAARLFAELRTRRIPIVHVVTEYRDAQEILANPFWRAIHDDPTKARKRMSGHNIIGEPKNGLGVFAQLGSIPDGPAGFRHGVLAVSILRGRCSSARANLGRIALNIVAFIALGCSRCEGQARHHAVLRGSVTILLRRKPRLTRSFRQDSPVAYFDGDHCHKRRASRLPLHRRATLCGNFEHLFLLGTAFVLRRCFEIVSSHR
jgi:hypothetical protein